MTGSDIQGTPADEQDFLRLKYAHDREHELKLNRATAAYEQATLRVLLALNGGSAAAFITLFGVLAEADGAPGQTATLVAISPWGAGLICAGVAAMNGRKMQGLYAAAYRHRRTAIERAMIRTRRSAPLARLTPDEDDAVIDRELSALCAKADEKRQEASASLATSERLASISLLLFVVGLAAAALAVVT